MERVQAVKITLSNGLAGIFYGSPILEPGAEGVTVTAVEFEAPRHVSGITMVGKEATKDAKVESR